ncbi:hypothetical protein PDIG_08960 [Penicillium digitatum PHI26]|uniref:Uncharacterized protein n=2 Tax=Penicillium digitatum TaxID=36651 RepID=K9GBP7_PEND2|nr:hypothetical protein PDIP_36990 [Penicillium digitatum Pd1]EKV16366.1 hypothetical protein PDIP_36990 [Penicillium digitatum Pd1]EKV18582.1 hypothetical protein PDIG_08960 [Penicillium digitatum PHI26]
MINFIVFLCLKCARAIFPKQGSRWKIEYYIWAFGRQLLVRPTQLARSRNPGDKFSMYG